MDNALLETSAKVLPLQWYVDGFLSAELTSLRQYP